MESNSTALTFVCRRRALWRAVVCAWSTLLLAFNLFAAEPPPAAVLDLVGLTRADVVNSLGKPRSTARRGDREILIYANGARVELVGDEVISFEGSPASVIIGSDGVRYIPGADGKVRRADGQPIVRAEEPKPPEAQVDTTAQPPAAPAEASKAPAAAEESSDLPVAASVPPDLGPNIAEKIPGTNTTVEKYLETGQVQMEERKPPPAWIRVVVQVVGLILRFGFVVLLLGLAMRWVGLPYYWPDLMTVAGLYVAVRETVYGIGGFGGLWEFIRIFKIADGLGYLALMYFLYKFEVVRRGITALKIATATMLLTYFLMMIVMLALTIGLMAFR